MKADEYLNDLFETAREANPDVPHTWVQEHIEAARTTPQPAKITPLKVVVVAGILALAGLTFILYNRHDMPAAAIATKPAATSPAGIEHEKNTHQTLADRSLSQTTVKTDKLPEKEQTLSKEEEVNPQLLFKPEVSIPAATTSIQTNETVQPLQTQAGAASRKGVEGVKLLELGKEDLMRLGIQVTPKGIYVPVIGGSLYAFMTPQATSMEFGKPGSQHALSMPFSTPDSGTNGSSAPHIKVIQDKDDKKGIYPDITLVTDAKAQAWRLYNLHDNTEHFTEESYQNKGISKQEIAGHKKAYEQEQRNKLAAKLESYVPVLVRCTECGQNGKGDIIIWYEPTPELFSALPMLMSESLCEEYHYLFVEKSKAEGGCRYYEACRDKPGAMQELTVYPNPAVSEFNFSLTLEQDRKIQAGIYSINGAQVKSLFGYTACKNGMNEFQATLEGISPGIYLLILETDKGEMISQRIVKR